MKSSYALTAPESLLNDIVSISVTFFDFEGNEQTGTIEVHESIAQDVIDLFAYIYETKFPLTSVKPLSTFNFDDDASMEVNNSSAFCFRTVALDPSRVSLHGYGLALDLNPVQNPYINQERTLPPQGVYTPGTPGTLDHTHPIVHFMKARGYEWGGDWDKSYFDYQHFQKPLSKELYQKYQEDIATILNAQ